MSRRSSSTSSSPSRTLAWMGAGLLFLSGRAAADVTQFTTATVSVPPATLILAAASTCPGTGASTTANQTFTTIYTTVYSEFCPTGLQPTTYVITETCTGQPTGFPPNHLPPDFITTVSTCNVCGEQPLTATLTIPCSCEEGHGAPTPMPPAPMPPAPMSPAPMSPAAMPPAPAQPTGGAARPSPPGQQGGGAVPPSAPGQQGGGAVPPPAPGTQGGVQPSAPTAGAVTGGVPANAVPTSSPGNGPYVSGNAAAAVQPTQALLMLAGLAIPIVVLRLMSM